jgi:hypothetical protein
MVKRINQATDEIITVGVMISLPQKGPSDLIAGKPAPTTSRPEADLRLTENLL